jgi:hypothetical protein
VTQGRLGQRALNRALLARQGLLARRPEGLAEALAQVGGLQAQYAPAMYVGSWSRFEGVERGALTAALEQRDVVQGTLLRATIHLVAPADYWPFAIATRQTRRRLFLRSRKGELTEQDMAEAAGVLRQRLQDGPVHRREAEALVGKARAAGVGLWVDLLRIPPLGTWERRRADLWALAEAELPPPDLDAPAAVAHLVRSYLRGFGPACRPDLVSYTGLPLADLDPVLEGLDLRCFRGPDGQELLDVGDGVLPDPDTPAPARFLPVWDATLLVHARRTGVLPEDLRPRVFSTRNPHGTATFLVDGMVAGAWRPDGERICIEPFVPLDPPSRRAVEEEADRLAVFCYS